MSRNHRSSSRGSDEMNGALSGRIPKKAKGNGSTSSNGSGGNVTSATASSLSAPPPKANGTSDDVLDPMAQALKAMQAFQEVTGEKIRTNFAANTDAEGEADKKPAAAPAVPQKSAEELAAEKKKKEEEDAAAKKKREEEEAAAKKKKEEDEARERQRIKEGYAKRQAFKPKIASASDSLL